MPAKSKSSTTAKGTKQRSFNLDDETFRIVEGEAARLHITNSAALSMILHSWSGPVASAAAQQKFAANTAARPPNVRSGKNTVLPPDGQETFPVKEDKANGYRQGGSANEEIDLDND